MSAQGEDLLAWLNHAIQEREDTARSACEDGEGRWHSGWCPEDELEEGETNGASVGDERDRTVVYDEGRPSKAQSVHIALSDSESVLRRCAADRASLRIYAASLKELESWRGLVQTARDRGTAPASADLDNWEEASQDVSVMTSFILNLAEGYGWTEPKR